MISPRVLAKAHTVFQICFSYSAKQSNKGNQKKIQIVYTDSLKYKY